MKANQNHGLTNWISNFINYRIHLHSRNISGWPGEHITQLPLIFPFGAGAQVH